MPLKKRGDRKVVRAAGVEPTTCGFGGRHSIQLSYAREIDNHTLNHGAFEPTASAKTYYGASVAVSQENPNQANLTGSLRCGKCF
jgi:hypothetical protein